MSVSLLVHPFLRVSRVERVDSVGDRLRGRLISVYSVGSVLVVFLLSRLEVLVLYILLVTTKVDNSKPLQIICCYLLLMSGGIILDANHFKGYFLVLRSGGSPHGTRSVCNLLVVTCLRSVTSFWLLLLSSMDLNLGS